MNRQIRTQGTFMPPSRFTERSNFDVNKVVSVVDNGIETHKKEYENKSHKVSHSVCPTELRDENDIKDVPLSKSIAFWTNYNEQKYNDFVFAKNEMFKHT